jgi:broad specificity phosphatase PhoE
MHGYDPIKSLAQALRERAEFLGAGTSSDLEYRRGDTANVIASLLETADVIDSWSGEYLSKELTYEENQYRRWIKSPSEPPMTREERIAAVKKIDTFRE